MLKDREVKDRLLFVAGDISPLKNPLLLLKAVAALRKNHPEISLHMVGDIKDGGFFTALQEFICQNQMEDHVQFVGPLEEDEVVREYEECSLFVLTSDQENLPMVIQQAMAGGKAVVATRVGGIPELIRDGVTGLLLEPGDLEGITRGIEMLISNEELRGRLSRAGKEEALRRFIGEVVARNTYEVYRSVLRGPSL